MGYGNRACINQHSPVTVRVFKVPSKPVMGVPRFSDVAFDRVDLESANHFGTDFC